MIEITPRLSIDESETTVPTRTTSPRGEAA
jgi:hypothetical protein